MGSWKRVDGFAGVTWNRMRKSAIRIGKCFSDEPRCSSNQTRQEPIREKQKPARSQLRPHLSQLSDNEGTSLEQNLPTRTQLSVRDIFWGREGS